MDDLGITDNMTSQQTATDSQEPEPENTSEGYELDLSELAQIVGGAGAIDEVGLQNTSAGSSAGWWDDPNQ